MFVTGYSPFIITIYPIVYSDDIFKEQNKLLEEQIKTIHASKDETIIEKYNLEAIIDFMHAKFTDLATAYQKGSLEQKKFLLSSIFPGGLVWTYPGISNSGISPFYRAFLDDQDRGVNIGADERHSFELFLQWLDGFSLNLTRIWYNTIPCATHAPATFRM